MRLLTVLPVVITELTVSRTGGEGAVAFAQSYYNTFRTLFITSGKLDVSHKSRIAAKRDVDYVDSSDKRPTVILQSIPSKLMLQIIYGRFVSSIYS